MKKEIIVKPLKGIEIKSFFKSIKIGIGEYFPDIKKKIGTPTSIYENRISYANYRVYISLDKNERIEFISIAHADNIEVLLFNKQVFELYADYLIDELSKDYKINNNDPELGYSYIFNELDLSLWRPCVPVNEEDKIENEDDYQKGLKFSTIGIGKKGYWSNYNFK